MFREITQLTTYLDTSTWFMAMILGELLKKPLPKINNLRRWSFLHDPIVVLFCSYKSIQYRE